MSAGAGDSAAWSRLAPGLRAESSEAGTEAIAVLIRLRGAPGARERQALQRAGVQVLASSGDLVSGRIAGKYLLRLAQLPFVMRIERAQPLKPEQE